jgi:hypothetical protein
MSGEMNPGRYTTRLNTFKASIKGNRIKWNRSTEVKKMNIIKFLVAIAAICVLVVPAFSMSNYGMGQDDKQKWQGWDDKQSCQGKEKSCDCDKPCVCDKLCGCEKFMMPTMKKDDNKQSWDGEKTMIGHDDKQMLQCNDDKEKNFGCEKSMIGHDDKQMLQCNDDKEKNFGCENSMMHMMTMMNMKGEEGKQMGHKDIKNMMAKGKINIDQAKIVVINLQV